MSKDFSELIEKPKWGPISAVVVTLLIYLGSQIIVGIFIGLYLYITGHNNREISAIFENSIFAQFSFIIIVEILSLWLLWLFLKFKKITFADIGLRKPNMTKLLYSLPAFVIYFIVLIAVLTVVGAFAPGINLDQDQQVGFDGASGFGPLSLVFVALVILPALVEEIMVRGFLYGGLRNKMPKKVSAIVASAIFGLAHLQIGSGEPLLWVAAIDTFILSLVLVGLREKTGNIWAGVIVHMMKNSLAFAILFIFKLA